MWRRVTWYIAQATRHHIPKKSLVCKGIELFKLSRNFQWTCREILPLDFWQGLGFFSLQFQRCAGTCHLESLTFLLWNCWLFENVSESYLSRHISKVKASCFVTFVEWTLCIIVEIYQRKDVSLNRHRQWKCLYWPSHKITFSLLTWRRVQITCISLLLCVGECWYVSAYTWLCESLNSLIATFFSFGLIYFCSYNKNHEEKKSNSIRDCVIN